MRVKEERGPEAARDFSSCVMSRGLMTLFFVSIVLALSAKKIMPLMASGFNTEKIHLTQALFFMLLPVIVLSGMIAIWISFLNAEKEFLAGALAPVVIPISIVSLILLKGNSWGVYSLAAGTLSGVCLQAIILLLALKHCKTGITLKWRARNREMRDVMKQYMPMVFGSLLMSFTGLIDQGMAAMLAPGSVSALSYSGKVINFFLGLAGMAMGTSVLPHFAQMVTNEQWAAIRYTLRTYVKLILLCALPTTAFICIFSDRIVSILFERGAFSRADACIVGKVQALYALQIPFYILGILFVRLISSLQKNAILMWGAFISLPLDVVLNFIFMKKIGVAGIALSTSAVYLVSCGYLYWMAQNLLKMRSGQTHG
jgi:putative peptidoglycan lipid II flippase